MRLILKDYISTFKEEIEMESLMEKILIMKDFKNIIIPQKGVGQLGVDFSAEKNTEIYLFVLKQQDIDRVTWDGDKNAVRSTLDEILDGYIPQRLSGFKGKINIILCTNGIIKQNVKANWDGYTKKYSNNNLKFFFWGIDELVEMTEQFLLNEYIFSEDIRADLRKSLYFFEEDTELRYFNNLLQKLINKIDTKSKKKKMYKKTLIVYAIVVRMCIQYSIKVNSKIAVNMSEKALITYWNFIIENELFEKNTEIEYLLILSEYYKECCREYIKEIKKVYELKPSFPIYNSIEYKTLIYEVIGIITNYTYYIYYYEGICDEVNENIYILLTIINNNVSFYNPLYDSNSIEINSLIYLLKKAENENTNSIIENLIFRITHKMVRTKSYYPVEYENLEKALDMLFEKKVEDCKATLLVTNLIEWLYVNNNLNDINEIVDQIRSKYNNITFNSIQIIVDKEELYFKSDYHNSTVTYVVDLKNEKEVKNYIRQLNAKYNLSKYKFYKYSALPYLFIASRNYRIPLPSSVIYDN